jgi:DNA-binding NarL/FixJ family response regulator
MRVARSKPRFRKALILHCQRLMVPLLKEVLTRAGLDDVVVYRNASERTIRTARPDVVVVDVDAPGSRPLEQIRRTRRHTNARIVVITRTDDAGWNAVAKALGADAILGARADRHDLFTAVGPLEHRSIELK